MRDFAVLYVTAGLYNLEPADLAQSARSSGDGILDSFLDAFLRRTCNFDYSTRNGLTIVKNRTNIPTLPYI